MFSAILREKELPHVCFHSELMGPIQSCDSCLVEVNGKLVRSCGLLVVDGMSIVTDSAMAVRARSEAFDVILGNHMLYCTVHNTALALDVGHPDPLYAIGEETLLGVPGTVATAFAISTSLVFNYYSRIRTLVLLMEGDEGRSEDRAAGLHSEA